MLLGIFALDISLLTDKTIVVLISDTKVVFYILFILNECLEGAAATAATEPESIYRRNRVRYVY
jgi:hypothetical protein